MCVHVPGQPKSYHFLDRACDSDSLEYRTSVIKVCKHERGVLGKFAEVAHQLYDIPSATDSQELYYFGRHPQELSSFRAGQPHPRRDHI
jgi:hypothetical protein